MCRSSRWIARQSNSAGNSLIAKALMPGTAESRPTKPPSLPLRCAAACLTPTQMRFGPADNGRQAMRVPCAADCVTGAHSGKALFIVTLDRRPQSPRNGIARFGV